MRFACPGCGAIYELKETGRLAAARGRVECFRCHEVFNVAIAVDEAQASPPERSAPAAAQDTPLAEAMPPETTPAESTATVETTAAAAAPSAEHPETAAATPAGTEPAPEAGREATPAPDTTPAESAGPAETQPPEAAPPAECPEPPAKTPAAAEPTTEAAHEAPRTPVTTPAESAGPAETQAPEAAPPAECPEPPAAAPATAQPAPETAHEAPRTPDTTPAEPAGPAEMQPPPPAPSAAHPEPPAKTPAAAEPTTEAAHEAPRTPDTTPAESAGPAETQAPPVEHPGPPTTTPAAAEPTPEVAREAPQTPDTTPAEPAGPAGTESAPAEHPEPVVTTPVTPAPETARPATGVAAEPARTEQKQHRSTPRPRGPAVEDVITGARPEYRVTEKPGERLAVQASFPDRSEILAEQPERPSRLRAPLPAWAEKTVLGLGVLALLVMLMAQFLWSFRGDPRVNLVLATICEDLGCNVPLLRQPGALTVTDRVFTRHPDYPDVLVLRLRIANGAGVRQPYPGVELVLYDSAQAVVGKSRVAPQQYLANRATRTLEPGDLGEIELVILDPGQAATGFAVEFF